MSNRKYIKRLFDEIVEFTLKSKGALVIVGPKPILVDEWQHVSFIWD